MVLSQGHLLEEKKGRDKHASLVYILYAMTERGRNEEGIYIISFIAAETLPRTRRWRFFVCECGLEAFAAVTGAA
jgi:hypothetical protein